MSSALRKGLAVCVFAIAICLMINGTRAESYGSDAPNAGISEVKVKPRPAKVVSKPEVVRSSVASRKRGKQAN